MREIAAQEQAEAGTAKAPADAVVGLRQRIENGRLHRGRDPDAGIGHFEACPDLPVLPFQATRGDRDRAPFGELGRVAQQVLQDLRQALVIAVDDEVEVRIGDAVEGDTALNNRRTEAARASFEHFVRTHRHRTDLQRVGLELGRVEQIVDECQQGIERAAGHIHPFPLLQAERTARQQFQMAHRAVQRRPDLVADDGQEHRLGPVGLVGGLLRLHQQDLVGLALVHVHQPEEDGRASAEPGP